MAPLIAWTCAVAGWQAAEEVERRKAQEQRERMLQEKVLLLAQLEELKQTILAER